MTQEEFTNKIFPGLKPLFSLKESEILTILMDKMDVLLKKSPPDGVRDCMILL